MSKSNAIQKILDRKKERIQKAEEAFEKKINKRDKGKVVKK